MPIKVPKRFQNGTEQVDAVQYTGCNFDEIERFVGGDAEFREGRLLVATLEGPLTAAPLDWIVKGSQEQFFALDPFMFAKNYKEL